MTDSEEVLVDLVHVEIAQGQGLRLGQVAKRIPAARQSRESRESKKSRSTSAATPWRWITEGVRAGDGSRVKLEAVKTPSGWMTSEPALARFLARLQGDSTAPIPAKPTQRRRAALPQADAAGQALQNIGM
jgi:hypothetical protein